MTKASLLKRLDELGAVASQLEHTLALLAHGSSGVETDRIDEYSDLDVWLIVDAGFKRHFMDDLSWLSLACPLSYSVIHGDNGYSVLFADGIFAEADVFELSELPNLNYAETRLVWKAEGVDEAIRFPTRHYERPVKSLEWMLGEALDNLYVGLGRFWRGEKLTAMRFIQVYAVDRILEMAALIEQEQAAWRDKFGNDRRFEWRFPEVAKELPAMLQGYDKTPESARAMLDFLDKHFAVDTVIKQAIIERLQAPD